MRSSTVTVTMMLVLKCSSSEPHVQPDLIIFIFSDTLKDSVSLRFRNSEKRKDNIIVYLKLMLVLIHRPGNG